MRANGFHMNPARAHLYKAWESEFQPQLQFRLKQPQGYLYKPEQWTYKQMVAISRTAAVKITWPVLKAARCPLVAQQMVHISAIVRDASGGKIRLLAVPSWQLWPPWPPGHLGRSPSCSGS